ncbi:hypothetical protein ACKFKG_25040 [Phormidesmis sp. 146-35]
MNLLRALRGLGWVGLFSLIFYGLVLFYPFVKGNVDRFMSNVSQDRATQQDMVYQTGNVRVYRFRDGVTTCYVADKQGLSTSLFCK